MHTTAPWSELVTAALLGSERRTPPGGSPEALLDAAAVHTVQQRAGLRPARAAQRLDPAPADPRPPLPPAARHRLGLLLADRGSLGTGQAARRGTAPDLAELLPQWLALANRYGYRAPAHRIPALLDAARARTDLRPEALALAGPRALWLARLNPDWKFALRSGAPGGGPGGGGGPDPSDHSAVRRVWEEGLFTERAALLTAVRRHDAEAARALLAGTWATERAEDRLVFLDSLREGLSAADEPFLARALSDRSRTVRATAAELLSALPASAFAQRMAVRARACVRLERAGRRRRIVIDAPQECDAGMERDGIPVKPPSGRGERSWWLGHILAATPLSTWTDLLGDGGASPAAIVDLPVADDWQQELHAAWCRAAVRQGDSGWARALLGAPGSPASAGPGDPAKLLTVLPPEERALWAARFISAHGLSEAFRLLGVCAVPWSAELGRSVVDALEIARDAGSYPWSFSGVMGLAERCLDPARADRLAPLAVVPDEPERGSPGASGYWAEAFQRLVNTLRLRDTMERELARSLPPAA